MTAHEYLNLVTPMLERAGTPAVIIWADHSDPERSIWTHHRRRCLKRLPTGLQSYRQFNIPAHGFLFEDGAWVEVDAA